MRPHESKKLLHNKGYNHFVENIAYRTGEVFNGYSTDKELE